MRDFCFYVVFFEDFSLREEKGAISYVEISKSGECSEIKTALKKPYHLSYPFIFEFSGDMFMIPETHSEKRIELYKCVHFPEKWEFVKNIMEKVEAVDTTIYEYNKKWWMFTNINKNPNIQNYDELFLFYTDDPVNSKWNPHPMNPINTNLKNSRSAGKIFEKNGNYFRPSQDCSRGYGYQIVLNKIKKINELDFEECIDSYVKNDIIKNSTGIHTLNFEGGLKVIDAKIKISHFF